jgi:hypothetical protein
MFSYYKHLTLIGIMLFTTLSGCEELYFKEEEIVEIEPVYICDEAAFTDLKGQNKEALEILLDIIGFNGEKRLIPHDSFIPMDFSPNRLTITLDENKDVSRTFCG